MIYDTLQAPSLPHTWEPTRSPMEPSNYPSASPSDAPSPSPTEWETAALKAKRDAETKARALAGRKRQEQRVINLDSVSTTGREAQKVWSTLSTSEALIEVSEAQ